MGYWDTHPIIENPPQVIAFIPSFKTVYGTDGVNSWLMNSDYFADFNTAQWIANKFGDSKVYEVPFFQGPSGPFQVTSNVYVTKLSDGRYVNCGILAGYYRRNPEDKFPGLAEKLVKGDLFR